MKMKTTMIKSLAASVLFQRALCFEASDSETVDNSASHLLRRRIMEDHHRDLFGGGFFSGVFGENEPKACPPQGFDALKSFDLESYISAPWYIQKQIPVAYQPVDSLYCVRAEYFVDDSFCLFCSKKPRVIINNSANRGGVDGEQIGGDGGSPLFRGIVRSPESDPAKVSVGFLADVLVFRSTYWVVAAGTYNDILNGVGSTGTDYEWAIVTGGSPSKEGADGKFRPEPGILNFAGMWMFVRDPIAPEGVVEAVDTYAKETLGLDTSAWIPVQHDGCAYPSS